MGVRRLAAPQKGFRCEYAARYALSAYASTVHIPLQEDYSLHDLYCILTKEEGKFLIPLYPFVVQVKSNDHGIFNKIKFDNQAEVKWLFDFGLPFYFGLCYLEDEPRLDLYKTSEKIALNLMHGLPDTVTLHAYENPADRETGYDETNIWMGKPIASIRLGDAGRSDRNLADALRFWIMMDIENLVLKNNNITIYFRCKDYDTNEVPDQSTIKGKSFYNTLGLPPDRKEKFGAILFNLALWEFAALDGKSLKIPWEELSPGHQELFHSFHQVIGFLSEEHASRFTSLEGYPKTS
jgi:hypothetical protein